MVNDVPISKNKQFFSLNVEPYSGNIPLRDIIDLISEETYVRKSLEPISKSTKKLFNKLITKFTVSVTGKLRKQLHGLSMVDTL